MEYTILIDYGKPYEEKRNSLLEVFKLLKEMEEKKKEDYAYFDIFIYDMDDKDLTEDIFQKYLNFTEQERIISL